MVRGRSWRSIQAETPIARTRSTIARPRAVREPTQRVNDLALTADTRRRRGRDRPRRRGGRDGPAPLEALAPATWLSPALADVHPLRRARARARAQTRGFIVAPAVPAAARRGRRDRDGAECQR